MTNLIYQQFENLKQIHWPLILELIQDCAADHLTKNASLHNMLDYQMQTGGKRLRALLTLLVADQFGVHPEKLLPFAAACEVLHNATLVHDDLQDGDILRRNSPTIWKKYGTAHAINLGDAMFYLPFKLIDRLESDLGMRYLLTQKLSDEILNVIGGQDLEFLLKTHPKPSSQDYFEMVKGKTSGLFALPIVGAAMICKADKATCDILQSASQHLGVIFQIQDDLLDLYGDKGRENRGSDLGEGKISMLVVYTLQYASAKESAWLKGVLNADRKDLSQNDIQKACQLFKTCGAVSAAFEEIDKRTKAVKNKNLLSKGDPGKKLYGMLNGLVDIFLLPLKNLSDHMMDENPGTIQNAD